MFCHLPLLRNADRSKISKRKNPVSLNYYRRAGYLPQALLNYLALMGGMVPAREAAATPAPPLADTAAGPQADAERGRPAGADEGIGEETSAAGAGGPGAARAAEHPSAERAEEFTLEEFVAGFDLERISLGGPVFDLEKLTWLNGRCLRRLSPAEWLARLRGDLLSDDYLLRVIPLVQERVDKLEDFADYARFFFAGGLAYDAEALAKLVPKNRGAADTAAALERLLDEHLDPLLDWRQDALEPALRGACAALGWSTKELFMTLRVATTGRPASPPLFDTLAVLGKETCRRRVKDVIQLLRGKRP